MKIHLQHPTAKKEDFFQPSWHILKALEEKSWTLCNIIAPKHTTSDILKVTCSRCTHLYQPFVWDT